MVLTSQIIVAHPIGLLEVCRDVAECFETSSPMPCQLNSCKSILTQRLDRAVFQVILNIHHLQ